MYNKRDYAVLMSIARISGNASGLLDSLRAGHPASIYPFKDLAESSQELYESMLLIMKTEMSYSIETKEA